MRNKIVKLLQLFQHLRWLKKNEQNLLKRGIGVY